MGMRALYAGFRYPGKEVYWRETIFRDIAIFEECYVPMRSPCRSMTARPFYLGVPSITPLS